MTDQRENSKRRRRLRLQFSLQTMLALTLLAAVTCAVLLQPKLEEENWAEGAFQIRAERNAATTDPNAATNAQAPPQLNGHWLLYDRYHTKLVEGFYRDDVPAGHWTYLDRKRRPIFQGNLENGACSGQWIGRAESREDGFRVTFATRQQVFRPNPVGPGKTPPETVWQSFRNGPARHTLDGGDTRAEGEYQDGERCGKWVFFNRDGDKTAEGTYRQDLKQGPWRFYGDSADDEDCEYYIGGRRIGNADAVLQRLENDLLHGDRRHRIAAADVLESFGAAAVPVFRRALASEQTESRLLAMRRLQMLGTEATDATGDLRRACQHSHVRVKFVAMVALAEIDPGQAERLYADLLRAALHRDSAIQNQAQQAILRAGPEGTRKLVEALKSADANVSTVAVEAVAALCTDRSGGKTGREDQRVSRQTIVNLVESVEDDVNDEIREDVETLLVFGTLVTKRRPGRRIPK